MNTLEAYKAAKADEIKNKCIDLLYTLLDEINSASEKDEEYSVIDEIREECIRIGMLFPEDFDKRYSHEQSRMVYDALKELLGGRKFTAEYNISPLVEKKLGKITVPELLERLTGGSYLSPRTMNERLQNYHPDLSIPEDELQRMEASMPAALQDKELLLLSHLITEGKQSGYKAFVLPAVVQIGDKRHPMSLATVLIMMDKCGNKVDQGIAEEISDTRYWNDRMMTEPGRQIVIMADLSLQYCAEASLYRNYSENGPATLRNFLIARMCGESCLNDQIQIIRDKDTLRSDRIKYTEYDDSLKMPDLEEVQQIRDRDVIPVLHSFTITGRNDKPGSEELNRIVKKVIGVFRTDFHVRLLNKVDC